jgi:ABC-2 type transport system ATP-binding protein
MTITVSVEGLTRRYRDDLALDDLTFDLSAASITGLLGRNGAGKTTLMRILAAQEFPSSGTVRILDADPVENDKILTSIVLVREDQGFPNLRVRHILRMASWFYPNWSTNLASKLVDDFDLPLNRRVTSLSRGMRTTLGNVLGLAARAPVTLFDEPYAGLDATSRQLFYDHLLADYTEHPRTVLLSTHLIDEAGGLLERVLVMERGRIVLDASTDELRGSAFAVSGGATAVDEFSRGRRASERRQIASQASMILIGLLSDADVAQARSLRLHLEPLSLQQVVLRAADHRDGAVGESA